MSAAASPAVLPPALRRAVAAGALLALLAAVGRIVVPFTVQRVTDSVTATGTGPSPGSLAALVGTATAVLACATVCGSAMGYVLNRAVETALVSLRGRMLSHVHVLTDLDRRGLRRGALVSRLTSDVDQISGFLQRGGVYIPLNAAQLVLTAGLMLYYSWTLALVVLVLLVPLARILPTVQRRLARRYTRVQELGSSVLALAAETVAGAAVVRAFGVQRRLAERLDKAVKAQYSAQQQAQRVAAFAFVIGEATVAVITSAVLVSGVILGVGGHLTLGELTAFLFLMTLFIQPLQAIAENLNDVQNAVAAFARIQGLLRLVPSVSDPGEHARELPQGPLGITLEGVAFTYPEAERRALKGVSLDIAPGRKVAVVGETGSGKSTLLTLLTRAADPTEGHVTLGGVGLPRLRTSDLRAAMHLVPQDGYLFGRTIAANVRQAIPWLDDEGVLTVFLRLGLGDWLNSLPEGIHTEVGEGGRSLSAGERQLIALARAYAADPPVLLLDEATSHLDPLTEARTAAAIEVVSRGRTTVAVAHRLSIAEKADEVVVMSEGGIIQRGPHAALVSQPGTYAELHAAWRQRTDPEA